MGIRTTETLKAQIEAAALMSGRSIAAEIEHRLERSFADEMPEPAALGRQGRAFLKLLDRSLRHAPGVCGLSSEDDWLDQVDAYDVARRELTLIMEALRPPGDPSPETFRHAEMQAQRTLLALGDETQNQPWSRWAASMRNELGPAMAERAISWTKKFVDSRAAE
jgi:hypothetical protein